MIKLNQGQEVEIIFPLSLTANWPTPQDIAASVLRQYEQSGIKRIALAGPGLGYRSTGYPDTAVYEQLADIFCRVRELVKEYDFLETRRGKGLMQGLVVQGRPVGEIVNKALENGLIVISAGSNVLRMLPPLVIEKEHIDEMIEKLKKSF